MIAICFLIFAMFSGLALFLYKNAHKAPDVARNCAGALLAVLIFVVGAELSVFNINYYTSRSYEPQSINEFAVEREIRDGVLLMPVGEETEFLGINKDIRNIRITLDNTAPLYTDVTLKLTDEANRYFFRTPERTLYRDVEKSQCINIHTSGVSENLSLTFSGDDDFIPVRDISVNVPRDFSFSFARVCILTALLMLIYIFRPSSPLYKQSLKNSYELKSSLTLAFVTLQCLLIVLTSTMNSVFWGISFTDGNFFLHSLSMDHHNQYDDLAQAILEGKAYIDNNDVPQSLKEMENPYDSTARHYKKYETGDSYRWDVAYYNGHYYVYFGIVPLLLMYLPCRLLFHAPFPSALGIVVFAMLFSIAVFKLLGLICEKYFKKISVGAYLLLSTVFINCCGAMFLVKRPDFYSVPIITGMTFIVFGVYLWLKGKDLKAHRNLYFLGGSLCCALAVGCRPQSVLMCAVALPVFLGYFFKDMHIKRKQGIVNLVSLALPFVVVASGIMYYNYIRFGSPFDFGSAYNLTTNDVTRRGFDMGRTGLGLFTYLFQPPKFTAVFPFLEAVEIDTNYTGKTIYEYCFGGLITSLPILWFIFTLPKVKDILKEKNLWGLTLTLTTVGIITVILNTQAGGLLQRYYSDFGYIFFIVAVLAILALYEKVKTKEGTKNLNTIVLIFSILSIVYTISLVFSRADATIDTLNPTLFGKIAHIVQFWL